MDLWIFDNDGTLYDDIGIQLNFPEIFRDYFVRTIGIKSEEASIKINELKQKWKTGLSTLAITKEYGIDFIDAINHTYLKIDLEKCGIPESDNIKSKILHSINAPKIVFTNSPSSFARRVLTHNQLIKYFVDFIGIQETQYIEKPDILAYKIIQNKFKDYKRIIFCDNSLNNLEVAHKLGWITIWYNPNNDNIDPLSVRNHVVISSFEQLEDIKKIKFRRL